MLRSNTDLSLGLCWLQRKPALIDSAGSVTQIVTEKTAVLLKVAICSEISIHFTALLCVLASCSCLRH
jgi:hypothetical protein